MLPKSSCFSARSAKNKWWFTIIRSASCARWCMPVKKHGLNDGQFFPVQVSLLASSFPQSSESSGRNVSSALSPVSVNFAQFLDLPEGIQLFHAFQQPLVRHLVQLRDAQKIRAPLHHRDFQVGRKVLLQKGYVLLVELLLKRFRGRGNHHAPPTANRRQQVRQSLSCPGAGLHN